MVDRAVLERHQRLPPDPSSASAARQLTADTIAASAHADTRLADTAILLVSELTTNALLHAGTAIEISIRVGRSNVRIEVRDGSVALPCERGSDNETTTGRGMELVELLASSWGAHQESNGKVVWFDLTTEPTSPGPDDAELLTNPGPMWTRVQVRGCPTALLRAAIQHGDAVLRELALLAIANRPDVIADTHRPAAIDLRELRTATEAALAEDRHECDIDLDFPPSAEIGAVERLSTIEHAQRLAHEGALLTLPATNQIMECHRWLLGQIAVQLQGNPPTAWTRQPSAASKPGEADIYELSTASVSPR